MNISEPNYPNELARLGFRLAGFRDWSLAEALRKIAEIGYKSVELCLEHPELDPGSLTASSISKIKALLGEQNLRVSAVSFHGKRDDLPTAFLKQKLAIELAQEFNTRVLVVGTALAEVDPQGCASLRNLEELVHCAENTGVVIAVEPEPDTALNGMYEFSLLASHLAGSPLGLNLDIGHAALTEGDVCAVIEEWAPFIAHTHFEDIRKPAHVHLLPGDGHLDLVGCVRKLRETGYQGDLTIDLFDIFDAPQDWAQKAMDRCQALLA